MLAKRRIIIASGGTGGHFYPGFALAQELRARGWQVLFLVKKEDIAIPALEAADLPYAETDMTSLPRSLNPAAHISFLFKLCGSLALARRIISDFRPEAVLGTGSYIAFPAVLAARLAGTGVYIHESNARFGLGNRLAAGFCRKAALGLPVPDNPFAGKCVLIGTPVRKDFALHPERGEARRALGLAEDKFTVLLFGGSQGARRLNAAMVKSAARFRGKFQLVHLAGRKNFAEVSAAYSEAGLSGAADIKLFDYREDMPLVYAAADLVVSRSGAGTVAELAALRKPAVLVPLPSAAGGHQKANALVLAAGGAAVCVEEGPDLDEALAKSLEGFLAEPSRAAEMARNFAKAGIPDGLKAAARLADLIEAAKN
ncbi:MAG: undecaprenyldiphospho-muramoylpentapeptide beta-N-acetylglucosaminyltransferase [Elusimicrobia bacterium CG08_land_8_20_14_0_20_59_10]|nr:MAG: undecaprenyldiphospho-muramoylpentapeptide beta-N-acetylglucosaminyltransferase [Elusimicrobia bacterium CG08_land_8_20_14_0_20_59_10]